MTFWLFTFQNSSFTMSFSLFRFKNVRDKTGWFKIQGSQSLIYHKFYTLSRRFGRIFSWAANAQKVSTASSSRITVHDLAGNTCIQNLKVETPLCSLKWKSSIVPSSVQSNKDSMTSTIPASSINVKPWSLQTSNTTTSTRLNSSQGKHLNVTNVLDTSQILPSLQKALECPFRSSYLVVFENLGIL